MAGILMECEDCKFEDVYDGDEPCLNCYPEDSKWQPKEEPIIRDCDTCKYAEVSGFTEPCKTCDGSKWTSKTEDVVNHPSHYETGKFECIDVMQEVFGKEAVQNFCMCNAFKYIYRCEHKDNKIQDINKCKWYLDKYLELSGD